jgi:hypothetical protein
MKSCNKFFELSSKSTFFYCKSWTHYIALSSPMASPMSTSRIGDNHSVLTITNLPWLSDIHMPTPILFWWAENNASILHLNLPFWGLDHLHKPDDCWIWFTCYTCAPFHSDQNLIPPSPPTPSFFFIKNMWNPEFEPQPLQ